MNIELLPAMIVTIAVWSLLYKETPVYRAVEHIFVGATMGYALVLNLRNVNTTAVAQIQAGNWVYYLAVVLGIMMYSSYFPRRIRWVNRIPVSIIVGSSIGLSLRALPSVSIFSQLTATMKPIFGSGTVVGDINNIVVILSFLFTTAYFTYTIGVPKQGEPSRALKTTFEIGKNFLMVYLGVEFGNQIIQRAQLLIARLQFILYDFLA